MWGTPFRPPTDPSTFPREGAAWLSILTIPVRVIRVIKEVILSDWVWIVRVTQLGMVHMCTVYMWIVQRTTVNNPTALYLNRLRDAVSTYTHTIYFIASI